MANDGEVNIGTKVDESGLDKGLRNVNNKVNKSAKDIGKGTKATKALKAAFNETGGEAAGFASEMESVAESGGVVAAGITAAILAAKAYAKAIRETSNAYRDQSDAETALQTAAMNNPYIDGEAVKNLQDYAKQLQSTTELGDNEVMNVMSQLISTGRTEGEVMDIIGAATDYAAATQTDLSSAAEALNATYSGMSGTLGRQISGIKDLTEEQLKNGDAVKIVSEKYNGFAESLANSDKKAANSKKSFIEALGQLTDPTATAWDNWWKNFYDSGAAAIEKINHKMDLMAAKHNLKNNVNNANTIVTDKATGKQTQGTAYFDDDQISLAIEVLENKKKLNDEESNALFLLKDERDYRKRNAEYAAAEAKSAEEKKKTEEDAAKNKKSEKTADDYAKESNRALKENLNALEVEAKAKGVSVTAQDKYNVYLQSYIDLMTKTEGLIKEGYPVEQKRLEQLKKAEEEVKAATDTETKLAAAIKLTQEVTETINGIKRDMTTVEVLQKEIADIETLKAQIKSMSDEEIAAAQAGAEAQLSKSELINGLNEAEKQEKEKKVNALTEKETSWWDKYASKQKEILDLEKEINESKVLSAKEKYKRISELDEAYSQSRKQQFAELAIEINGYVQQTADIAKDAGDLMLKNVQTERDLELATLEEKYEKGEMSETEYYEKQKQIKQKAAREEYKIQMFQWTSSLLAATANIAEGVSKAIALGFPQGLIAGALVGASGAVQIASIIANKPIPPQFYAGGIIGGANGATYGSDNTYIHARTGEMVLNAPQQRSLWDMINGQDSRQQAGLNLTINNTQSNRVDADVRAQDGEVFIDILDNHINKGFTDGTYDAGLAARNTRQKGVRIL